MDLVEAIEIALKLARQAMVAESVDPEAHAHQKDACDTLEDFAVNQLGDD
jgi:hypothetical protein